jgi:dienelactone hydrolase
MRKKLLLSLLPFLAAAAVQAKVIGRNFDYAAGSTTLKGYIAYDDAFAGKRPGVLVVHEWWGQNAYVRKRADMLAKLGYTALALDMYGNGKVADHPQKANEFSQAAFHDFPESKKRFEAAMDVLKKDPTVDGQKIAAIGYCFGGAMVLNMARQGEDLKGVASFHGGLYAVKPAEKGAVKAKVLVCHGEKDMFSTPEQIAAFKKEMTDAGADYTFNVYPGATHAFTNPDADALAKKFNLPFKYSRSADKKSWADLQVFLKDVFK